jgi:Rieske Fe-S protein
MLIDDVELPYRTHGAVVLPEQVQLHPVRYVQGVAAALGEATVFENTRVTDVSEGSPCVVRTADGEIRAGQVVVATHYPILDRGLYFARLDAQRSYCIAARLASGTPPQSMSISAGSPTRSIRGYGDLLVVGGEGHAVGDSSAGPDRFAALESFARAHWDVAEVSHRWSAQDPSHYDKLPVIGRYSPVSSRLWVASGFMKWGLTSGTFAAMIISDAIMGRANPWASTFSPARLSPRSSPDVARLGAKFALDMTADRLRGAGSRPEQIAPGTAGIIGSRADRVGVYRDEDGGLHGVSVRCTHLGCLVRFNAAERSWDCPCHGSRFGVDGEVLEGPAVHPLPRRDVP